MEGLAVESGVAKNAILALEKGRGNPTIKTLEALSRALGIQIQHLIGDAPLTQSQAHATLQEAARMLTALALASPERRACVLALIYRDESYLETLPRDVGQALRALGKVP